MPCNVTRKLFFSNKVSHLVLWKSAILHDAVFTSPLRTTTLILWSCCCIMAPTSTPQNDRSSKLLFTTPPGRRRGDHIWKFSHCSPLGLTAPVQMPSSLYLLTHTWGLDSHPVNLMYVTFSPPPSRYECLKLLANVGADIDALDFNGHTALYRTLKVVGDSVQLNLKGAKFLVAKDVNLQGKGEFSIRRNSNHVSDNILYP